MYQFLINLFLYTFAIYGVLVLFHELTASLNCHKGLCKVVLIVESGDAEKILGDISWELQENKSIENIYVLNKNNNDESNDIIQKYCDDNDLLIFTDKQEILEIINEK